MTDAATDTSTPPVKPERDPKAKIPGLELTWGDAEILELTDEGINELVKLKAANPQSRLNLIPLRDGKMFIARNCSRTEWRQVVSELQGADTDRARVQNDPNLSAQAIEQQINMLAEDRLVARFLVHPKLSVLEVRDMDPGDVKCLHDSILMGIGFAQPPRSIKL